jgi:glycosyltransferase involved in cell wall biosynthesis
MSLATWSLAVSAAAILYIYAGYPALVAVLAVVRPRPVRKAAIRPSVTVVIPAHNEAGVIEGKLENTLALDYPRDRLEVLVVSDGSTDGTDAAVKRYEDPRLRLLVQPRQGKAFALNRGVAAASGEIVVLTDANTVLQRDALARLVESFADPRVGGVAGNKRHRPTVSDDGTGRGESVYWRFDTWQKACESRTGNVFAADGALYALRRNLYVPIEDPAQADDMAISMRIVLQGHRLVFEPDAVVFEEAPAKRRLEFARKVRVTNHSLRALLNLRRQLWTSGFYSVQLLSHKFLRHFSPVLLLILLGTSAVLARSEPVFQLMLAAQVAVYALGGLGLLVGSGTAPAARWLFLPAYFCLVNVAALRGIVAVVGGRRLQLWTPRGGDAAPSDPEPDLGAEAVGHARGGAADRIFPFILMALLLPPLAASAQEPPTPPPDPSGAPSALAVALTVASIYDTNLDYLQGSLPAYGALAGVDARFQSRPDRPALLVEYTANIQSYSRTDKWDRVSQRGRAILAARLGPAWTVDLASSFSLASATEDRELVDELVVGPRLEYRAASSSVLLSGGQQLRRRRLGGLDTKSDFAAIDLRGRLAGRHGWGGAYRFESVDSEDPRRRSLRSTYGAQYSRRVLTRGWLGVGLRYRAHKYPERMVHLEGEEVPRQDRGWQAHGTWVTNLRPGPELRLQYRYESRQSNIDWAEFDAHHLTLAVRQPLSFPGSGRAAAPAATPPPPPPARPATPRFTSSALSELQVCALNGVGETHCWPADATALDPTASSAVSSTLRFSAVAVGSDFACALNGEGRPYCWGGAFPTSPTALRTNLRFTSLTAGSGHVCALTPEGRAYCWGDSGTGALGSHTAGTAIPVPVAGGHHFRVLTAGWQHTCGLTADGTPYCWGGNRQGEMGALFTSSGSATPALVTGSHRFSSISAGTAHTCGVTPAGAVYCWGANTWGQLGNGSTAPNRTPGPTQAAVDVVFAHVTAGADHTCALTTRAELYCWGRNERGQLGSGSQAPVQASPVVAGGGVRYKAAVAARGTCGITVEGELRCWGSH